MTDTFNPPCKADSASGAEYAVTGIDNKFGDGYSAFVPYGINAVLATLTPKWTNLYYAEAVAILSFFEEQKGAAFYYTPNGETAPKVFRCKKWTPSWKHGRKCDISATFEPAAPNS